MRTAAAVPAAVLLALTAAAAWADATIVTRTRIDGIPDPPAKATATKKVSGKTKPAPGAGSARAAARGLRDGVQTTTYYRGGSVRTETSGGATIFTPTRVYLIDDAAKTYQAVSRSRFQSAANPLLSMVRVKSQATLLDGGKTATMLGKPVRNWIVVATLRMEMPSFSGLGGPDGGAKAGAPPEILMKMRTEVWVTEAVDIGKATPAFGMGDALPADFVKPILDKMKAIRGLPLKTVMVQSIQTPGAKGTGPLQKPATIVSEVVSLDEKPLPASLFLPPKGYKQVPYAPPTLPGLPSGDRF